MSQRYEIRPFGPRGYSLLYSSCDSATLMEIRNFQQYVASVYPDWATKLDYSSAGYRLHVFPLAEFVPAVLAAGANRYRSERHQ